VRVYEEPRAYNRAEAAEAVRSQDAAVVSRALVGVAFYDEDWGWVQSQCVLLAKHPSPAVRCVAATCLGHLARIHGQLDREIVNPVLDSLAADPDPTVSGCVSDARDDLDTYLK